MPSSTSEATIAKLSRLGRRRLNRDPIYLFSHIEDSNDDIIVQSNVLISLEERLEIEKGIQDELRRENQTNRNEIRQLEERIDYLYEQLLGIQRKEKESKDKENKDKDQNEASTTTKNGGDKKLSKEDEKLLKEEEDKKLLKGLEKPINEQVKIIHDEVQQFRKEKEKDNAVIMDRFNADIRNMQDYLVKMTWKGVDRYVKSNPGLPAWW